MRTRVWMSLVGYSQTGARWRVEDEDGNVLVERTRNPEFASARVLTAAGFSGALELWRKGAAAPALVLDIAKGAKLTTSEGDFGLRVVEWSPITIGQGDDDQPKALGMSIAAVASGRGRPNRLRMGVDEGPSFRPLASGLPAGMVAKTTQASHNPNVR